jgi:transposase
MRTVLRALALRQLADGKPIREVAKDVGLTPKTVWLTSQRYRRGGLGPSWIYSWSMNEQSGVQLSKVSA